MNLKPFFSEGWWLAVIMMEPLARVDSSTQTMNMAGVVHMPQSSTSQSAAFMPRISASFRRGPEERESWPTASLSLSVVVPYLRATQRANT